MKEKTTTLSYISGIKAFMLLVIFLAHAGVQFNQISQRACDFLFVFSGYLLSYKYFNSYENIKVIPYIKNKLVRFYPLHFIGCIICLISFKEYNQFYSSLKSGFLSLGLNLTLLQSWYGDPYSFNSVSWFLSCLIGVYLVAPFVLRLLKKVKTTKIYVLILIIVWIARFFLEYYNGTIYNINIYHFPVFSIFTSIGGMIIYPLSKNIKGNYIINSILEIGLLAIIVWLAYAHVDDVYISIQVLFIWITSFIFVLNNDIISSIMSAKIWNIISKLQMEFYLIHQIIIRFLVKIELGDRLIFLIILSFLITYVLSVLYNTFLKKRLERIMCKILNV